MKVKDIMRQNFFRIQNDEPVKRANQLLHQFQLKYLIVVDNDNKLLGIVTYSDLFRHLLPSYSDFLSHADENILFPESIEERTVELMNKPVTEIMTKEPITASPDLPIVEAGALMLANKVKQLPVVKDEKLLGVVSYTDITWGLLLKNCKYF